VNDSSAWSLILTYPFSKGIKPSVSRNSVVLPEPLEPISAWVAPCGIDRSHRTVRSGFEGLIDVFQLEHGPVVSNETSGCRIAG